MPAVWKGSVTFGLVNVPVRMYGATTDHDVTLHQVHAADGGRIRYQRTCEACGQVVKPADIAKAVDEGDQRVIITDEDLESLPVSRSREIEVVEFVPREEVDPIRFDRSYYLEPTAASPKAYVLLTRVLEQTERLAIVHLTLRTRSRLAALRTHDGVLVLHTLLWDDEVRSPDFRVQQEAVPISDQEMSMSAMLVESLSEDFSPQKFVDDYQVQLRQLVEAKLASGDARIPQAGAPPEDAGGEILDLMEALRRSVEASRKEDERKADVQDRPAPKRAPRRRKAG